METLYPMNWEFLRVMNGWIVRPSFYDDRRACLQETRVAQSREALIAIIKQIAQDQELVELREIKITTEEKTCCTQPV